MFLYSLDMPDSSFTAAWPKVIQNTLWNDAWAVPALYGDVILGRQDDCRFYSDSENIPSSGSYDFNENLDGHHLLMNIVTLTGSGDVIVTQNNCKHADLPGADPLPVTWVISADELISSFSADLDFYYTDADVSTYTETDAYLGIAWFNESANAWTWKGGTVNANENKVTVQNVAQSGKYVLYRRIFGDSNGDGYVNEADLQQFADVWLNKNATEFDQGSSQNFFNYNKNTNADGDQIIDEGDLQVFSDNWLNGTQP